MAWEDVRRPYTLPRRPAPTPSPAQPKPQAPPLSLTPSPPPPRTLRDTLLWMLTNIKGDALDDADCPVRWFCWGIL